LAGKRWKSIEVHMFRKPPADDKRFRQHFSTDLRFRTEHAAIVFPTSYLTEPLPGADPVAYAQALHELEDMDAVTDSHLISTKVNRVLYHKFIAGEGLDGIELNKIAELFELHPRTFNRRLKAEGAAFNTLLAESRYNVALQLLRDTQVKIRDIAFLLGYADTASFNRAFRRWSGTTATQWRSSNSLN